MWVIAVLVFVCTFHAAYAAQVPDHVREKIESWALRGGTDSQFGSALYELSEQKILKTGMVQDRVWHLPSYGQTTLVGIAGKTGDYRQTSPVLLTVLAPDGTRSNYTVPVLQSGAYHTVIPISHDSPTGTYEVTANHAGKKIQGPFFYVEHPSVSVPRWVAGAAELWLDGKITDREFFAGLEFLLRNGIIGVSVHDTETPALDVSVSGHKAVRRGTTQDITVHVSGTQGAVDGVTVFVRVEDYGQSILKEFRGATDSRGDYSVSWEISDDIDNLERLLVYVDVTDGILSGSSLFTFEVYCLCGELNCKCRT